MNSDVPHALVLLFRSSCIGVQLHFAQIGILTTEELLDMQCATNHFRAFCSRRALRFLPFISLRADPAADHRTKIRLG